MPRKRSSAGGNLALIAATALATLALQRHFAASPRQKEAGIPVRSDIHNAPEPGDVGRIARSPWQIPWTGWKDVLARTYHQINEARLVAIAAGVVFYGLLAIFPAITALVSSYGLFADASTISDNIQTLTLMLPEGSFAIVQDQIGRVLAKGPTTLGVTFVIGILVALWSANAGTKAIIDALNVVYEEEEKRGFLVLNLVSLGFTVGALASILFMVGAIVVVPLALESLGLGAQTEMVIWAGRWPILAATLLIGLAFLYRYGPSRAEARWNWLSVGAIAAATLWLLGSSLLSWYLANFGNYSATYGSLGAAIGLMMWMWMSAIIVLCGAELDSEIEYQLESTAPSAL